MPVTHSNLARNAATDAVLNLLFGKGCKLVFRLNGTIGVPGAEVATLTMASPAFGPASNGTATAGKIESDTNARGNNLSIATASLQTAKDVLVIHCSVTASGTDINMTNGLVIAPGDTVTCGRLTYTALSS